MKSETFPQAIRRLFVAPSPKVTQPDQRLRLAYSLTALQKLERA